jgi:hypothetical protein
MRTATSKTTIKKSITKSTKPTTKSIPKKMAPKKAIAVASKTKGVQPKTPLTNRAPTTPESPKTKQSQLITLLKQPQGSDIKELMQATGWQAHSIRGVISGVIRKRLGLTVVSHKMNGVQHYRIKAA